jgi:hypothetical protein
MGHAERNEQSQQTADHKAASDAMASNAGASDATASLGAQLLVYDCIHYAARILGVDQRVSAITTCGQDTSYTCHNKFMKNLISPQVIPMSQGFRYRCDSAPPQNPRNPGAPKAL